MVLVFEAPRTARGCGFGRRGLTPSFNLHGFIAASYGNKIAPNDKAAILAPCLIK